MTAEVGLSHPLGNFSQKPFQSLQQGLLLDVEPVPPQPDYHPFPQDQDSTSQLPGALAAS